MSRPPLVRITKKLELRGECLVWTGATINGHPTLWDDNRVKYARRIIVEAVRGGIPPGSQIRPLCRDNLCLRLSHQRVVTRAEWREIVETVRLWRDSNTSVDVIRRILQAPDLTMAQLLKY